MSIQLILPVTGPITQKFGAPPPRYGYSGHNGTDFGVPSGTPVKAAAAGVVDRVAHDPPGYGYYVVLKHNDGEYLTYYAHLSALVGEFKPGDFLPAGLIIAFSGNTGNSTGPHLHWELRIPAQTNPGYGHCFDPMLYLEPVTPPVTPPAITIPTLEIGGAFLEVTVDTLNVRSGPGTSYPIVGKLQKGDLIESIAFASRQEVWVQFDEGWCAALYNGDEYMGVV